MTSEGDAEEPGDAADAPEGSLGEPQARGTKAGVPVSGSLGGLLLSRAPYAAVRAFELMLRVRREPSLAIFDELVRKGDVVADVGAHRGVYADRLSRLVGRQGRVHAFEPNPDGRRVLEAVARHRGNLTIHPTALSDRAGTATLMRPVTDGERVDAMGSLSNPVVEAAPHDSLEVPVARLDDELASEPGRVALVKIDVEGHEQSVLQGAEGLLASSRPFLVMEIEQRHRTQPLAETFDWLLSRGYAGFVLVRGGRRPIAAFDVERDQLAFVHEGFQKGSPGAGYVNDFLFVPLVGAT
ncbi:MAG: hypothetical protein QOH61_1321 [Chloroflexota bacterium]|jgi:FkbM family methyltransferase|nr:hypothetical protein [Chloroflexota bacterium]